MRSRQTTIRDVARRAGVSTSTVSRVLTGSETAIAISEETQKRVLEAAKELGYRPHPGARALLGKNTGILGLIVREIDEGFFGRVIQAVNGAASEAGCSLIVGSACADPGQALALSEILDTRYCDGLFLLGDLQESPADQHAVATLASQCHLISLCRGDMEFASRHPSIGVDNRQGVVLALDYLAQLGHRDVAFVGPSRRGDLRARCDAYAEWMREHFGEVPAGYIQSGGDEYESGFTGMSRLLALPNRPTAVYAVADTAAVGALAAAADRGLDVPADISIIGFDDIKLAAFIRPALTTVRQPIDAIASRAVDLMMQMVQQGATPKPVPHILVAPELVVRDSCSAPRQDATGK